MLALFSIAYWILFALSLPLFFAPAAIIWLVTWPFDRRRALNHLYGCFWASCYVWANPLWRLSIEGRERLPWKGPAVIVANHLSLLDILVLYGLFRPFKWVSKAELFRIPFVGWNMTMSGYVPLWRGDRESIKQMMAACRAHLDRGSPLLIFPEGTRSKDGKLQPFKDGAFRLACEAGCPIIPVAVSGTWAALPKHGLVLRQRMRARVKVLAPIDPAAHGHDVARLREATRAAIAAELPPEGDAPVAELG
jgi:1-acyl-sn-glycerol-3-phosphate acyltransferase